MRYTVFAAFNAILLLLLAGVDCMQIVHGEIAPDSDEYEYHDSYDDDPCQVNTELTKIRDELRAVKSLVEGLRKKLDPDFKTAETDSQTAEARPCPEGFEYLSETRGCYKAIEEKLKWSSAMEKCQSLNAHLISIDSREESEDVTKYLIKQFAGGRGFRGRNRCYRPGQPSGHAAFWTSGQRVNMSDCSSEFVWKTAAGVETPLNYTQWLAGEPNCWEGDEKCVEILFGRRSVWNDVMCYVRACPLCEYDLN